MLKRDFNETAEWLDNDPPLNELKKAFPVEWENVEAQIQKLLGSGDKNHIYHHLQNLSKAVSIAPTPDDKLKAAARYQMTIKAINQHLIAIASGIESGKVKLNLWNSYILHYLLFKDDLERKPVSLFWFKIFWNLVTQKRFLIPLLQPKGIYCFYTKEFIAAIASIIGDKESVELAAGDGTLSHFLKDAGVSIKATDDYSWKHSIKFPESVEKLDAVSALKKYSPKVVITSWAPAMNRFEKQIFVTKSVEIYIAIGSRNRFAAGNFEVYEKVTAFDFMEEKRLSSMILPPEIDPAVYIFRRKKSN